MLQSHVISIDGEPVPITAFVSALNTTKPVASQLVFSTLLGGSGAADIGLGLAYDASLGTYSNLHTGMALTPTNIAA